MLSMATNARTFTELLTPEPYSIMNPPNLLLYNPTPCFILLYSLLAFDTYFVSACESAHTEHFERLTQSFLGQEKNGSNLASPVLSYCDLPLLIKGKYPLWSYVLIKLLQSKEITSMNNA